MLKSVATLHFVLLFGCFNVLAAEDGTLIERITYQFPSYEQAVQTTDVENYTDKATYEKAVNDKRFAFEKLKYSSDQLKVVAYLYKPKQVDGRKLPTIIFNRPSAVRGDIAPELIAFFHGLASEGFIVIAPMLRQSDGGEGHDEIGGADMNDLMNIVPLAKSLAIVDMDQLFMYGSSRGGMMTYQAISRGFPIKAAAVFGAFTDLQELIDAHPKEYSLSMLNKFWPNYATEKTEIARTRSAIYWPERLNIPLLIMHGGADRGLNPEHSLKLATQLQKLGKVYQLLFTPRTITRYQKTRKTEIDKR